MKNWIGIASFGEINEYYSALSILELFEIRFQVLNELNFLHSGLPVFLPEDLVQVFVFHEDAKNAIKVLTEAGYENNLRYRIATNKSINTDI